ncbi:uncharacterized protein [Ptychodera flava]|uniref:uncharacterized protein n=1 Tax=Ptychodera flava TaxID=63121 RepID=UPI00396A5B59
MRRQCDEHGEWAVPDTTYCVRDVMTELHRSLNDSVLEDIVKTTDLLNTLAESFKIGETIYGGDLLVARDILSTIAHNEFLNGNESRMDILPLIKNFLNACSQSLNLHVQVQWKQTYGNYGPEGSAVTILSSLEHFGATVYLYMLQTGRDIFLQSKNVDLVGSFVRSGSDHVKRRKKYAHISNDTYAIHDTVTLSSEFIEQFRTNISDIPVATVMFVCRNMGSVLPADFRQRQAKRTWVKSITTSKIVKAVNTVALAVSVHPKLGNVLNNLDDLAMIRLYKEKEAYNPRCSSADIGPHTGIWDTSICHLLHQGIDEFGEYVVCGCKEPGTICAIMSLGKQPMTFLESANKTVTAILSGVSTLLITTALVVISSARLSSDSYFVLGQTILSLESYTLIICIASSMEATTSLQQVCYKSI